MEKRQLNQLNMLLTVETHFDNNELLWTTNIPVSDTKTALTAKINLINEQLRLQRNTSTGATLDKKALRKDLEEKGFLVSSAISSYASIHGGQDQQLKRLDVTKNDFSRFRDNDLLVFIEDLDTAAMLIIEALGAYGVTQATLTALMAANDAFHAIVKIPEEVTSNRRDATETISDLLHEAIAILDDTMDKLMPGFGVTQPQFVNVYFIDREIHHIGTHTLSLEILTLNANDNTPLNDAHIEVVGKGIKRKSTDKGMNRIQNLVEGNYTLSVNRLGFVPQMVPFMVISGETTQLVIQMQSVLSDVTEEEEAE